ncbi:MAG: hypothetical protein IPQ07_20855 [Myxococcales bacterium]|nr:hypothetical protein [Myxococcales bacterium]
MTPRRYQLKKEAAGVVLRDHPWIFRDTLSSAAVVFRDGDWLRLVDWPEQGARPWLLRGGGRDRDPRAAPRPGAPGTRRGSSRS